MNLEKLVRKNIWSLKPYSSARDEFKGEAEVYLDANESPFNTGLNRYPDPYQWKLKEVLSKEKNVPVKNILLGNGSDEVIDLLYRTFCNPGIDNVIICPPTYGMYEVSANINDIDVKKVNLNHDFQLNVSAIIDAIDQEKTKLIFICSPNNPTANSIYKNDVLTLIEKFNGIVVVDEAYIDFTSEKSFTEYLDKYPNLVVMQTLSKAWGLAAIRLGILFAQKEIINIMNKVKPPYNVNELTQKAAIEALSNKQQKEQWVKEILAERNNLEKQLAELSCVEKLYPSDANFILAKVTDAKGIYNYLVERKIIVRDRSNVSLCENCLRITVGTKQENEKLIAALKSYL
ncbi:MAG: histidinol-phosphate transaminase [Bacteroidia bacterium]